MFFFTEYLNNNDIENYSQYKDGAAVIAERFKRTILDPLEKPMFKKTISIRTDEVTKILENPNNNIHYSTKKPNTSVNKF